MQSYSFQPLAENTPLHGCMPFVYAQGMKASCTKKPWGRVMFERLLLLILMGFMFVGCAQVPKEVVELSYRMGGDIEAIHKSYDQLIHDHFDLLRQARLHYLNDEWKPLFIKKFIKQGRLVKIAKGEVVVSDDGNSFIAPVPGKEEAGLLNSVTIWSSVAVKKIEGKKQALLEPLNDDEKQLLSWVDDAFNRLYRGNAAITAHLNSLRKVQEVQDDALKALNMEGLRDKINNTLINISDKADKYMDDVRKVDGIVKKTGGIVEKAKEVVKHH